MRLSPGAREYITNGIAQKFAELVQHKFAPETQEGEFGRRQLAKGSPDDALDIAEGELANLMPEGSETSIYDKTQPGGGEAWQELQQAKKDYANARAEAGLDPLGGLGDRSPAPADPEGKTAAAKEIAEGMNSPAEKAAQEQWAAEQADDAESQQAPRTGPGPGRPDWDDDSFRDALSNEVQRQIENTGQDMGNMTPEQVNEAMTDAEAVTDTYYALESQGLIPEGDDEEVWEDFTNALDGSLLESHGHNDPENDRDYDTSGGGTAAEQADDAESQQAPEEQATFVIDNGNYELAYNPEEGTWDSTDPDFQELSLPGDEDGPQAGAMGSDMEPGEMTSGPRSGTRNEEGQISEASQEHQAAQAEDYAGPPQSGDLENALSSAVVTLHDNPESDEALMGLHDAMEDYAVALGGGRTPDTAQGDLLNAALAYAQNPGDQDAYDKVEELDYAVAEEAQAALEGEGAPTTGRAPTDEQVPEPNDVDDMTRAEVFEVVKENNPEMSDDEINAAFDKAGWGAEDEIHPSTQAERQADDQPSGKRTRCETGTHKDPKTGQCKPIQGLREYITHGIQMRFAEMVKHKFLTRKQIKEGAGWDEDGFPIAPAPPKDPAGKALAEGLDALRRDPDLDNYGIEEASHALLSGDPEQMVGALELVLDDDVGSDWNPAVQEMARGILGEYEAAGGQAGGEGGGQEALDQEYSDALTAYKQTDPTTAKGQAEYEAAGDRLVAADEARRAGPGYEGPSPAGGGEQAQDEPKKKSSRCEKGTRKDPKTGQCKPHHGRDASSVLLRDALAHHLQEQFTERLQAIIK